MSAAVPKSIDSKPVKLTLAALGVILTAFLLPLSLVGLVGGILERPTAWWTALIGSAGLAAICAAWARVLIGGHRLNQQPVIRFAICLGLLLGIIIASILCGGLGLTTDNVVPWVYLAAALVGVVLLAGTIFLPNGTST